MALLIVDLFPVRSSLEAVRGSLDLSASTAGTGVASLAGEWELYWGRLLGPSELESVPAPIPDGYLRLPSIWTRSRLSGHLLPSEGDATYRLRIRHPWKGVEVGIKILRINHAFELYADSRLIAHGGSLSNSPGGFEAGYAPQVVYFTPATEETFLTLRVSNRLPGAWSGPVDSILIGPRKAIEREADGSMISDAFNASGRLLFFVLFLALGLVLRNRLALVFSLTSLIMALRLSMAGEMFFLKIFPAISFGAFGRLYLIMTLLPEPFLLFSYEAFLREGIERPKTDRGRTGNLLRGLRARDWVLIAAALHCLVSILYFAFVGDLEFLRHFELFVPVPILCFAYYSGLIFYQEGKRRIGLGAGGLYLLVFYYTAFEVLCQMRVIDQGYSYPLFFLRGIPALAGLAKLRLQQGLVGYFSIAFLGIYFAYDILSRHFSRAVAARPEAASPPSPPTAPLATLLAPPPVAEAGSRPMQLDELAIKYGLSDREKEILSMAAQGLSYEEIGERCFISKNTVKTHLGNIYRKLEVKNKTELANKLARRE
jgi:Response regulator containing a CheY-like receiver domain and an HTH DNA-binding domain